MKILSKPSLKFQSPFTTLRGTLLSAFGLLSVLVVGIGAVAGILLSVRTSQNLVFDRLVTEVELTEQAINNWLEERKHDLAVIVNNPADAETARSVLNEPQDVNNYDNFLKRLQVETGPASRFDEIFLINIAGQTVLNTNEDNLGELHKDQAYFQKGRLTPFISSPTYDAATGKNDIMVTVPLKDELGGTVGILTGRLNLSELGEIVRTRASLTQSGETYLVSKDQRFLTSPKSDFQTSTATARSVAVERALTAGPYRNGEDIYENYEGVPVVGAYRWMPDLEVVLISEKTEDESLAGVQQLATVIGGVAVVVLIIATVGVLFITSRVVNPIAELTQGVTAITEGNLIETVVIKTDNEIGVLAQAFNQMTERLRNLINTLEDRVKERTRALETAAEISLQLNAILNTDELLRYVVERIQTEFDFYHMHIYLIEAGSNELVMAHGSGEVGRQLKEQGHRLKIGQGIVGTVAKTNKPLISNDVSKTPNFVRNRLLPNTNSELAVPLQKGDRVLGVLDIQSEQLNRFTQEDLSLVQSIANQTATALDNARLLAETQTALQEVERLNRRITRQGWQEFKGEVTTPAYRFQKERNLVVPDPDAWITSMKQAAAKKQRVKQTQAGNGAKSNTELAVPLMLRGEMIGVLGVKREEKLGWAEEEVSAVEAVANQVALALENARLSMEQEKTIIKLQDVDRLKSEFLTSMSHELRTPLNSIIGFADVLLQGIDGELNEIAMHDIQLIYNSGQHLLALINDILDLSKIEAGKMELICEALEVKPIIDEVLAATNSLIKKKVEVIVDVPGSLPPVYADRLRLSQVLLNLVSNAAKFTEEGKIAIVAKVSDEDAEQMFFSVADTGIGIPPNKLGTIFDRFSQGDSSTTRKYGGTGLGLPICRQLVEMHDGKIGVTSEEGKGSTFYFTIPLDNQGHW